MKTIKNLIFVIMILGAFASYQNVYQYLLLIHGNEIVAHMLGIALGLSLVIFSKVLSNMMLGTKRFLYIAVLTILLALASGTIQTLSYAKEMNIYLAVFLGYFIPVILEFAAGIGIAIFMQDVKQKTLTSGFEVAKEENISSKNKLAIAVSTQMSKAIEQIDPTLIQSQVDRAIEQIADKLITSTVSSIVQDIGEINIIPEEVENSLITYLDGKMNILNIANQKIIDEMNTIKNNMKNLKDMTIDEGLASLNETQYKVYTFVTEKRDMKQKEIAEQLSVTPAYVSQTIKLLKELNLIVPIET